MNVSERVSRIEGLMSQTIAQINLKTGVTGTLSMPSEFSMRPMPSNSQLFSAGSLDSSSKEQNDFNPL